MKQINKILIIIAAAVISLTGCIYETFPEGDTATSEQVGASASAVEAAMNGIPSQMSQGYLVYDDQVHETDMAYPLFMLAQTQMLGDIHPIEQGYDWYSNYNHFANNFGDNSYFAYLPWFTLYKFIKSSNDIISSVDLEDELLPAALKGAAGVAYASRAFDYYMLTVMFEPVENIYTDVSKVLGLTVPIVTEETTNDIAKNNPRVPHDDMIEFILSDLEKAEELMQGYRPPSKLFPDLSVVYGIRAKVHLWDEDYENAALYARKAINEFGGTPVTQAQWLDLNTAFNTANQAWMWHTSYSAENMRNLANFMGWISPEAGWSYADLYQPMIDRSLYDKINKNDFRKYSFLDPGKFAFHDYQSARGRQFLMEAPDYLALKFRPKGGDWKSYETGGSVDVPIMRVEEMYLIEAEALAVFQGVGAGVAKLNEFMQNHRQEDYNYTGSDLREFQLEVLTQMRIEFWGEGNAFPSAKRLKPGVMQNYAGTNVPNNNYKINCQDIKPNWNLVIPISEVQANAALEGWNNPDPTNSVGKRPHIEGEYADAPEPEPEEEEEEEEEGDDEADE